MGQHSHERKWWKEAVVYQAYPASFKDSDDDGIGDIPGIISKLNYIRSLGVDVLWISPHYKSLQIDGGFDIVNHEEIHEAYGTLEQCQELIHETHKSGMKIIFDLVMNHTSHQHRWFLESRSSKQSPKRDWYIWRPAKYLDGVHCAPNNWRSQYSVPAWTWDETTEEYYFHMYAPEMPDLNWDNDECRQAIYQSTMIFWLDRGIDGFRIDTANKFAKDMNFPDVEVTLPDEVAQPATKYYSNMPRRREFLLEIREIIDRYQNIMTVGALPNTPLPQNVLPYVSAKARQLDMAFNFDTVCLGQTPGKWLLPNSFTTADFKRLISRWQTFIAGTDGWTTIFLENYDQGRSISRFASDQTEELRARSRKLMAMILATMTGTLFIYQGQEVGMVNAPRSWGPEEYKDIRSVNFYARVQQTTHGDPQALGKTLDGMQKVGRDHARLPMQWDATANAGFCSTAKPWMRAHDNFREVNVAKQIDDENSVLEFWKSMLRLRKQHKDVLVYGEYELIDTAEQDLFIFAKRAGEQRVLTVANFIRRRLPRSQTMGSRLFYDWNW